MTRDLDGALYDAEGRSHRPIAPDWWERPHRIELVDGRLVPYYGDSSFISAQPEMLERFLRLANASDAEILAFARRFGMLDLCAHGRPRRHDVVTGRGPACELTVVRRGRRDGTEEFRLWRPSGRDEFDPQTIVSEGVERPIAWRKLAAQFVSLIEAATQPIDVLRRLPWEQDPSIPMHRLVRLADVRPMWHVPRPARGDSPQLLLGSFSLLGALTVATLYAAVGGGRGLALCANCGDWFARAGGSRSGRHAWCPKPGCQRAKLAAASRAYRRRAAISRLRVVE
jgi:hypothetical protein